MNGPLAFALGTAVFLAGCASLSVDSNLTSASALARGASGVDAGVLRSADERRAANEAIESALAMPLAAEDAVRIAVVYSPSFQAMLFDSAAASAEATQSARIPNPIFTFERLVRNEHEGVEKEIGRMLGFSVFELLLLPSRLEAADYRQQQLRVRMAGDIVQTAANARQAWVKAVAAQQLAAYSDQVQAAAEAGAELARRMQAVGNFSKLQRAREQAFYAEATAQVARARQGAQAAREALVRVLGLDPARAPMLVLPGRLSDLPPIPKGEAATTRIALEERFDVRMAKAELEYLARRDGLTRVTSYVDGLRVAAISNSETGKASQKGFEVEVPLPLFDFGDARRAQSEAAYMAALNRAAAVAADAASQVRESYGAYRAAYDIARHYRDEIVPLRKAIAGEMLLKYNGMLIGVFDLLADSREQIGSVMQAIEAQRDFWLADAALDANLVGRPAGLSRGESP